MAKKKITTSADRETDGWTWAAAAACEERRHEDRPWGEGDHVAEVLLAREAGDFELLNQRLDGKVGRAPGGGSHFDFGEQADALWKRLGLRTDTSTMRAGAWCDTTPWHVWLETDPEAPYFHKRALLPPDPDLAAGLAAAGRNLRPLVVVPGAAVNYAARSALPPLVAGRRRTAAARYGVRQALCELVQSLRESEEPRCVPPPRVLGLPEYMQSLNWECGPDSIRLLGLLRVEVVDPDSTLATWAVNGDNDLHRAETPMSAARQVQALLASEDEDGNRYTQAMVARMKGVGTDTIANLLSLMRLVPDLQELLEEGAIDVSEAYRLSRIEKGRQRQVYEATRGISPIGARIGEIQRLGAGHPPSPPGSARVAPTFGRRTFLAAATRIREMPPRPPDSAEAGARAVFRYLAGDDQALEQVSESCRAEIQQLLAREAKK